MQAAAPAPFTEEDLWGPEEDATDAGSGWGGLGNDADIDWEALGLEDAPEDDQDEAAPAPPAFGDWAAEEADVERPPSSSPTTYRISPLAPWDQSFTHPGVFAPRPNRICTLGEVRGLI